MTPKYITDDGQHSEGNCTHGLLNTIRYQIRLQFKDFLSNIIQTLNIKRNPVEAFTHRMNA